MAELTRDQLLVLTDDELLRVCRVERRRGTGPGGQKRNKTESAVTVTHQATGCSGSSDETRSQISNRLIALRHLRLHLALRLRQPPEPSPARQQGDVSVTPSWPFAETPSLRSPAYPLWAATLLDVLAGCGLRISEAAAFCGTSTGRLVRDLARDPALWQEVNRLRRAAGLTPLRGE